MKVYSRVHEHVTVSLPGGDGDGQAVQVHEVYFRDEVADVPPDVAAILLYLGGLPTARPGEYEKRPEKPQAEPVVAPDPTPPPAPKRRRKKAEEVSP